MRSFLRKYVSNRGSALFMVISTMTALMISCMAMYFSVISSRSTQYAIFNQQQSKQVSMSINDAVLAGMMDGQLQYLFDEMGKLNVGEKLTTDANGFAEFGGDKAPDDYLGAYRMEITRLEDSDGGAYVFDIVVTSSLNGANSIYHNIIEYSPPSGGGKPTGDSEIFTAAGYVPNDVHVGGGRYLADMFFDNEMTYIAGYETSGTDFVFTGNVTSSGSVRVGKAPVFKIEADADRTWAVRNKFEIFSGGVQFKAGYKNIVLVGGDLVLGAYNGNPAAIFNADVYVLGDLVLQAGDTADSNAGARFFVDGNVKYEPSTAWGKGSYYPDFSNLWLNGSIVPHENTDMHIKKDSQGSWNSVAGKDGILTVNEMIDKLGSRTESKTFYKWEINDNTTKYGSDGYVAELDKKSSKYNEQVLDFTHRPTIAFNYEDTKGVVIKDTKLDCAIWEMMPSGSAANLTVLVDTGESEDNIFTIRVMANRDIDGDGKLESFCWRPTNYTGYGNNFNIIVKGRGSLVIDVPEGVVYQDETQNRTLHYGWFLLFGGKEYSTTSTTGIKGEGTYYDSGSMTYNYWDLPDYVHTECNASDNCKYTELKTGVTCAICGSGELLSVKCEIHGVVGSSFCPSCEPDKKGHHEGACLNHTDREYIDTKLAGNSTWKTKMTDTKGKIIYPTCNIFVVSCAESADIRFSSNIINETLDQNFFCGYIYAPYMTYKAWGGYGSGNFVRFMGGMTVSDYILNDNMALMACWPDKMPIDLMSSSSQNNAIAGGNKSWKISLKAH